MVGFAEIQFDMEGDAFFTTDDGSTFYLNEFLMDPDGKGVAHISNVAGIEVEINDLQDEVKYKLLTVSPGMFIDDEEWEKEMGR